VSTPCFQWRHFAPAATLTLDVAERNGGLPAGCPPGLLLNLNVRPCPAGEMRPLRLVPAGGAR